MPRLARNVFPGIPHHITQRGNRQEDIFFSKEDRLIYLQWLGEYCQKHKIKGTLPFNIKIMVEYHSCQD